VLLSAPLIAGLVSKIVPSRPADGTAMVAETPETSALLPAEGPPALAPALPISTMAQPVGAHASASAMVDIVPSLDPRGIEPYANDEATAITAPLGGREDMVD